MVTLTETQERQVEQLLTDEAVRYGEMTREAREKGLKDEAKGWQRAANAYSRALQRWNEGVRPNRLEGGRWMLPSQRTGEAPHILSLDGDWVCTCQAGQSDHWAKMLVVAVVEVLAEAVDPAADVNDLIASAVYEPAPAGWQSVVEASYGARERRARYEAAREALEAMYA